MAFSSSSPGAENKLLKMNRLRIIPDVSLSESVRRRPHGSPYTSISRQATQDGEVTVSTRMNWIPSQAGSGAKARICESTVKPSNVCSRTNSPSAPEPLP